MNSDTLRRNLIGRRCNSILVYEAHGPDGIIDHVAMLVLGFDLPDNRKEWVRIFFDAGGWSWTAMNEPVAAPEDPTGELWFPATDVAATLGVTDAEIRLADLVPRAGPAGRLLLGFSTGAMLSVEHDGDRTSLQAIPPAA